MFDHLALVQRADWQVGPVLTLVVCVGRAGGLGLGLSICRRLVEAHGGVIRVTDRPGGGSEIGFRLPLA